MIRVLLFGAGGRMGRLIQTEFANHPEIQIAAGVEDPSHPDLTAFKSDIPPFNSPPQSEGDKLLPHSPPLSGGEKKGGNCKIQPDVPPYSEAEVWVDFSLREPAMKHLRAAADLRKPFIAAVTGFSPQDLDIIQG
ncbi:MAG: hypothetical protein V2A61_03720, partial [Calditrichota bacterium]